MSTERWATWNGAIERRRDAMSETKLPTFYNRQAIERELESIENPRGLRLNDGKERSILPGGTLRRVLNIIDEQAELIEKLEAQLASVHDYAKRNPLGGPAAIFDSCGDAVRAGDPMELAMAAYGLSFATAKPVSSGQRLDMPAICAALGFDPTNHHNAAKCPYCSPAELAQQPLTDLVAIHSDLLKSNPYAYFELAYTRRTGWMAWVTDKPLCAPVVSTDRKVLYMGQGSTHQEACANAAKKKP